MDAPAFLAAGLALALAGALAAAAPAGAAESGVAYEPGAGGGLLKSLAGAAYLALVAVFVLRLLSKRANSSLTQRWASLRERGEAEEAAKPAQPTRATPLAALWGAAQAGGLAYGMWLVSTGVDAYFDRQALPNQYTVRNITVTIRTVTQGLAYLATFIFGANAVGLTALAVQLVINPEAVEDGEAGDKAAAEAAGEDARSR